MVCIIKYYGMYKNRLFWYLKYAYADNMKWKQNVNNVLSRKKSPPGPRFYLEFVNYVVTIFETMAL